jgi:hypothetical protein
MFPKKGKIFPVSDDRPMGKAQYAAIISAALRSELDNSHRSIKTVMRWTGAKERTVKNWFAGTNGPRGEHLFCLARNCEALLTTFNKIARGGGTGPSSNLDDVRGLLCDALAALDGWVLHENRAAQSGSESANAHNE